MDKLALVEIIEYYLEGKLALDDRLAFEKRMGENPDLKQTVWEYREIIEGIKMKGEQDFVIMMNQWENQIEAKGTKLESPTKIEANLKFEPKGKKIIFQKPIYLFALAACLVLLIVIFLPHQPQTVDSENLFAQYFEPYPDMFTVMGDSSQEQDTFVNAINAYNKKQYNLAVEGFAAITQRYPDSLAAQLYLGVSYIMLEQIPSARAALNTLIYHSNKKYKEVAEYYLALTYLQTGEIQKAEKWLTNISLIPNHDYQEEAINVLAQIQ